MFSFGRKDGDAEHAKEQLAKEHAELVKLKDDLAAAMKVRRSIGLFDGLRVLWRDCRFEITIQMLSRRGATTRARCRVRPSIAGQHTGYVLLQARVSLEKALSDQKKVSEASQVGPGTRTAEAEAQHLLGDAVSCACQSASLSFVRARCVLTS
jgi:hypothetical protein